MKRNLLLLSLVALVCSGCLHGCAVHRSDTTEIAKDGTQRKTHAFGMEFFDSTTAFNNFKNTVGGTNGSGTSVGSANSTTSGTNATALAGLLMQAAAQALVQSAK